MYCMIASTQSEFSAALHEPFVRRIVTTASFRSCLIGHPLRDFYTSTAAHWSPVVYEGGL